MSADHPGWEMPGNAAPADPAPELARWVGQSGEPGAFLDVLERSGRLFASGLGLAAHDITAIARGGRSTPDGAATPLHLGCAEGQPTPGVFLSGKRLPRRDFGAEAVAAFQAALGRRPTSPSGEARAPAAHGRQGRDLVDLKCAVSSLIFDIRYASADNFMGRPLYDRPAAYLQRPAAEAIQRVQAKLMRQGYGLIVHDAYRPWSVTKLFWDAVPEDYRMFVADPASGS